MSTTVLKTAILWLVLTTTAAAGLLDELGDIKHLGSHSSLSGELYPQKCGEAFLVPNVETAMAGLCWGVVWGVWYEMQRDAKERNVSMPCPNSTLRDVALAMLERLDSTDKVYPATTAVARHLKSGHCIPEFLGQ